jgi:hypothetical protein
MGFSGNRDGSQGWSPPVIRSGSRRGKPNCNPFACGAALSVMPRQNQGWQPRRQPLAPTTPRLPFKFVGWCQAPAPTLLGCRPPRPSCGLAQCQDGHAGPPRASAHPLLRHVAVVPSADQAKVLLPVRKARRLWWCCCGGFVQNSWNVAGESVRIVHPTIAVLVVNAGWQRARLREWGEL